MLERRPEVPFACGWLYERYWEIDREGWSGRPTFRGMCAVLDEYGIRNPQERESIRRVWWRMVSAEHACRERQRERDEEQRRRESREITRGAPRR